jgi:transposase-like protein
MNIPQHIPAARRFTINDFNELFFDNDACLDWLMEQRYPDGLAICSYCKVERKHYRISTKKAYSCDHCGTYISPMAGTIFEKSSTSLRLWFYAMYLMSATRCGISAKQIQRECGVTYKTAWRMFKQIRTLMAEDLVLSGPVEMDEATARRRRISTRTSASKASTKTSNPSSGSWSARAASLLA